MVLPGQSAMDIEILLKVGEGTLDFVVCVWRCDADVRVIDQPEKEYGAIYEQKTESNPALPAAGPS